MIFIQRVVVKLERFHRNQKPDIYFIFEKRLTIFRDMVLYY